MPWCAVAWATSLLLVVGTPVVGPLTGALPPLVAYAETNGRERIAVIDFRSIGTPAEFGEAVAENLRNDLVASGRFAVVERSQIQQVLKEQSFGQSGLVNETQAISLGKLLGAQVIVIGSVTKLGRTITLNARFLDVRTGEATMARSLSTSDEDALAELVAALAEELGEAAEEHQRRPTAGTPPGGAESPADPPRQAPTAGRPGRATGFDAVPVSPQGSEPTGSAKRTKPTGFDAIPVGAPSPSPSPRKKGQSTGFDAIPVR